MPDHRRPVLIVDDDPANREFLVTLLRSEGYPVTAASDGEEGLAMARAEHPCLILLDLMMPVIDGFGFRAAQLRSPELANTPVILISALDDPAQVARRIGPMAEVRKPIDVDALLEQVALYCERATAAPTDEKARSVDAWDEEREPRPARSDASRDD
jgi:CheY-like chemotaxis protein